MSLYDEVDTTYTILAEQLDKIGIIYIHIAHHSLPDTPAIPESLYSLIRSQFSGTLILCGGYDAERAEQDLQSQKGDLIAFGRPFIANPDFPARVQKKAAMNKPDNKTFYTSEKEGYTDYPFLDE
jgi:N-ethylmaleimide reductase